MSTVPPEQPQAGSSTAIGDTESNRNVVQVIYLLQALSFAFGVTGLVAVIVCYVKRDDMRGTWLGTHVSWQLRTFWWGLLWTLVGFALMVVVVGVFVLCANAIWVIYRIAKGWLRLNDRRPMDIDPANQSAADRP